MMSRSSMEVISSEDDSQDRSCFIIDETPFDDSVQEVTTNSCTNSKVQKKKKKRGIKRNFVEEILSGGRSEYGLLSKKESLTKNKNSNTKVKSVKKKCNSKEKPMSPPVKKKKNNSNSHAILIESDCESTHDEGKQKEDVIEVSDDEVEIINDNLPMGTIGGELAASYYSQPFHMYSKNNFYSSYSQFFQPNNQNKKMFKNLKKRNKNLVKNANKQNNFSKKSETAGNKENVLGKLRPIVIDGSNVAFGHGVKEHFSCRGLEICVNYFKTRGHKVKCFVPQYRRRHRATLDSHILDQLEKDNVLVFTPSRNVGGKRIVSYDDRFVIDYATQCGGVVVSRDNYQDIINEKEEWKETITNRLLMFTWVDDTIMFPQDPLGREGPHLDDFLRFPPEENTEKSEKN